MKVFDNKQMRLTGSEAVEIENINGTTDVIVSTTGKAVVRKRQRCVALQPALPRYHWVAHTDLARMGVSSHGAFKKVEIRMPADATRRDFIREMGSLFDMELINRYL